MPSAGTAVRRWRRKTPCPGREEWPPSAAGRAGVHRRECRRLAAETKGDRTPMVSCPLLTPLTFLRDAQRSFASKRGLRGRGSGRRADFGTHGRPEFTLRGLPRITVRGQTVQGVRFTLRKVLLQSSAVSWSTRRHCGPLAFRRATEGSRVRGKMWGCQEGDKKPGGCLGPLLSPPPDGSIAHAMSWRTSPGPGGPVSPAAASRRNGGTAYPLLRVKIEGPCFGLDPLPPPCYNK